MKENQWSLRDLYRSLDTPGENPLREAHDALDKTVMAAYGFSSRAEILEQLLQLNLELAAAEAAGETIQGPGTPLCVKNLKLFVTNDCLRTQDGA